MAPALVLKLRLRGQLPVASSAGGVVVWVTGGMECLMEKIPLAAAVVGTHRKLLPLMVQERKHGVTSLVMLPAILR